MATQTATLTSTSTSTTPASTDERASCPSAPPAAARPARKRKIDLDVCNEYDAKLSKTYRFTLPRTRRGSRAWLTAEKFASKGDNDAVIRTLEPFPCEERANTENRMLIRLLSSEIGEEPRHVAAAHDDVLDEEVSDWEHASDDESCT